MWRRALLAAAAVSYLICVLIMGGMQKEDLDLSMLGKLQRYNVNLDDINNEQTRQQCASRNNSFTASDDTKTNEGYVSTTEYKSTIIPKDPLLTASLNLDSVINYLKTRKDSITNLDETIEKTTITDQEVTPKVDHIENEPKIDMDLLRQYIQLEAQKKTLYNQDGNSKTDKRYTSINLKTNERNTNKADDVIFIDKLLKDYLFKQQKIPTTTEYTTSKHTINIQNIYKQINELIANESRVDDPEVKNVENVSDRGRQSNSNRNVITSVQIKPQIQKMPYSTEKQMFEDFYKLFREMTQFKYNSSRTFSTYDDEVKNKVRTDKSSKPLLNQDNQKNYKESTLHQANSEMETNQKTLTPILVQEIAETVRRVIMKDLRNELADIYFKTTQTTTQVTPTTTTPKTTTERSPTTTSKSITQQDLSIIDKFMNLYEQIKSLKQATYLMKVKNESAMFANDVNQSIKIPVKNTMFLPPFNRLPITETKLYISSFGNYNTEQYVNHNLNLPRKENNQHLPLTIQTNSVEIQPLAIPVSKPESLIRQNIVVQPRHHSQYKDDYRYRHFSSSENRYTDSNVLKYKNRTYKHSPLKPYDGYIPPRYPAYSSKESKQRQDIIRFRLRDDGTSKLNTDYYERINFDKNDKAITAKQDIFSNHIIPRFHERLERVDINSNGVPVVPDITVKQENVDFPTRQQLSLIDMKKGSPYDDTHFKNFLKTQQKVTDMLEKILSARPKTNTPLSVETI